MLNEFKILLTYIPRWKKVLFVFGAAGNAMMGLATALIVQRATEMEGSSDIKKIMIFGLVSALLYFYVAFIILLNNTISKSIVFSVMKAMKTKLLKKFIVNQTELINSEKLSIFATDMDTFQSAYLFPLLGIPMVIVGFASPLIYILSQNFLIGSLFVIGSLTLPLPQIFLNNKLKKLGQNYSNRAAETLSIEADSINGTFELRNNGVVEPMMKVAEKSITSSELAGYKENAFFTVIFSTGYVLKVFAEIIPFMFGLVIIGQGGSLKFSVLLAMFMASQSLKGTLQSTLDASAWIQGSRSVVQKIYRLLSLEEPAETEHYEEKESFQKLVFHHISKSFADKTIFKDFSFEIDSGMKVLIKGESGRGKSTLLKIMTKEIPLDSGSIYLISGDKKWTSDICYYGVVSQEPFIFNGSLRFNLALGQDFKEEELLDVLEKVNLSELTLNQVIKNNGQNLSGGQKIRIELARALTRALIRKKKILLVDEVTASLDKTNSKLIRDLIYSLPITTIEVAHHIDDEGRYDKIITL
ncbi:MAG: ABC transporter ATP-binding protein/permease [Streptococcaceae bacterium]|jgi:ATP-binding cassette subfamily B protein|nr:ABC transporter ATP-binding protein/permease [Streptococcaceae bacterium]